jgi:hypothetical protein
MDTSNLFAVLTLIVAPAALTNATSVLALNTANRFGRVIDRSRVLAALPPEEGKAHATRLRQLRLLRQRGVLLMRAQSALYAALGLFVSAALVAVVGAASARLSDVAGTVIGVVALCIGAAAAGAIGFGCVLLVRETRLALQGLRDDVGPFGEELGPDPRAS